MGGTFTMKGHYQSNQPRGTLYVAGNPGHLCRIPLSMAVLWHLASPTGCEGSSLSCSQQLALRSHSFSSGVSLDFREVTCVHWLSSHVQINVSITSKFAEVLWPGCLHPLYISRPVDTRYPDTRLPFTLS